MESFVSSILAGIYLRTLTTGMGKVVVVWLVLFDDRLMVCVVSAVLGCGHAVEGSGRGKYITGCPADEVCGIPGEAG